MAPQRNKRPVQTSTVSCSVIWAVSCSTVSDSVFACSSWLRARRLVLTCSVCHSHSSISVACRRSFRHVRVSRSRYQRKSGLYRTLCRRQQTWHLGLPQSARVVHRRHHRYGARRRRRWVSCLDSFIRCEQPDILVKFNTEVYHEYQTHNTIVYYCYYSNSSSFCFHQVNVAPWLVVVIELGVNSHWVILKSKFIWSSNILKYYAYIFSKD